MYRGLADVQNELDKLFEVLLPGDTMVVWRLDRLGRSLKHLVDFSLELAEKGVEFRSLREAIDTTTASGRLYFNIMSAMAEFSVIWTRRDARLPNVRAAA